MPVIHGVLAELGHLLYKETLQRDHYHRVEKFGNSGINVFLNPSILSIYNDKALCIGFEEFKYTFASIWSKAAIASWYSGYPSN